MSRILLSALRWAPKSSFSHAVGWLSRRHLPNRLRAPLYRTFANRVGADLSEVDGPLGQFPSFDQFFTRPHAAGARPLEGDAKTVLSPVDGELSESGVSTGGRLIQCKDIDYTVAGLLADRQAARSFEGGAYATLYLAPRNYHRVHAPLAGSVSGYHHIPGAFYPVNRASVERVPGLFSVNERLVTYLDTALGRVAVVMVAAAGVGHMTLAYDRAVSTHVRGKQGRQGSSQRYAVPLPVGRGDEIGTFHLGSTVILLFEPGRVALDQSVPALVRLGQRLGSALSAEVAA